VTTTTTKSKAGRGGAQCARASIPPTTRSTTIGVGGGQVARPDGRRLGPSERGASDHWRSHRPFLRHRLDDRSCPLSTSLAPHRHANTVSLAPLSVTQHQTGVAAAADHRTGESQVVFYFKFFKFIIIFFFFLLLFSACTLII
jgi:hypothetical protein